jgi:hypothetical protein
MRTHSISEHILYQSTFNVKMAALSSLSLHRSPHRDVVPAAPSCNAACNRTFPIASSAAVAWYLCENTFYMRIHYMPATAHPPSLPVLSMALLSPGTYVRTHSIWEHIICLQQHIPHRFQCLVWRCCRLVPMWEHILYENTFYMRTHSTWEKFDANTFVNILYEKTFEQAKLN